MTQFELHQGDCLEVLATLPDESVDLVVTSPPYDNLRTYGDLEWNFNGVAGQLCRILKDGAVIVWVVGDAVVDGSETGTSFEQALAFKKLGLRIHDTMIYQKRNFSHPDKSRYHQVFEYMFVFSKGQPKTFNPIIDRPNKTAGAMGNLGINTFTERDGSKSVREKRLTAELGRRHNVWLGNTRGQEDMCVTLPHPAMMPRWVARDHIESWSNEGDTVLDPFMGSGTTGEEAVKLNRQFIGIEKEQEYVEIATARIEAARTREPLFLEADSQKTQGGLF